MSGAIDPALLESWLGGTQCGQCGYEGCRPYAEAMSRGEAGPERCAPGGAPTAHALARALARPFRPPAPAQGEMRPRPLAVVIPELCVGCMRCLEACPADALAGTQGRLHYVLPSLCTGCGLCLPACPMDCIRLAPVEDEENWRWRRASSPEDAPQRWTNQCVRGAANRHRQAAVAERRRRAAEERKRRRRPSTDDGRLLPGPRHDDPDSPTTRPV